MKVKRQKRVAKILKFFHLNFGFRSPYQVVIDGTFCAACLQAKVNIKDQMPKYLGEAKLTTTGCCISELESLGSQLYGATLVAKGLPLHKCGHKEPVPANKCLKSLVKSGNPRHFLVASQDPSVREELRSIPGVPVIYLHGNAPTLEKPSDATESLTDAITDGKTALNEHQRRVLAELKRQTFGETDEDAAAKKKKKRKGPKGPNPLSCKKSKKPKNSRGSEVAADGQKRKRKRNRKKGHGPQVPAS